MKKSSKKIDQEYVKDNSKNISKDDLDEVVGNEVAIKQKLIYFQKLKNEIIILLQLLRDYKNKKYTKPPWMSIAAIVFALLYVLNPLDLVPDFIPFVGYIDDASMLALTLRMISGDVQDYQIWKANVEDE
jgi:uncharacterized membrane protein YkvA (DUF1232 family)